MYRIENIYIIRSVNICSSRFNGVEAVVLPPIEKGAREIFNDGRVVQFLSGICVGEAENIRDNVASKMEVGRITIGLFSYRDSVAIASGKLINNRGISFSKAPRGI